MLEESSTSAATFLMTTPRRRENSRPTAIHKRLPRRCSASS